MTIATLLPGHGIVPNRPKPRPGGPTRSSLHRLGEDHWLAGAALSIRGGAQAAQQRFDEAEDTLLRAYETLENSGSAAPVFVDATRQRLASLYEQTGRPGEMAPYQLESNE